jgi:Putative zinc-finger
MNCEQCQESISLFLDNELEETSSLNVRTHLAVCAECAKVCEEFAMILDFCTLDEAAEEVSVPPNSKALWCRINNIIENEIEPETAPHKETVKSGFLSSFRHSGWRFSFSQILLLVLGIGLLSSLLTIVGFTNYNAPDGDLASNASITAQPTMVERVLGKFGLIETPEQARERRLKQQQATIEYWNNRVEARRANWDNHLRQTFDRNLAEINQVVFEYDNILQENPQDELSGEMLDSALNEKMELLREFSDL